ncbi:MAG TPA: aromatic ring-hydroxylating dioxygenase subunit alpha [Ramlibacter sp.]|nr:aromatic ring-hydroxylating dioxygenase subunit alpha [Ramlibacter sp.]
MDRKTLEQIVAQVETYMDQGATALWDQAAPQVASRYADPAWHAREWQVIRSQPVIVGHASKLKAAGDFFTHDAAGVPILVVRQEDGSVKAMLNICRHRGSRLVTRAEGQRRAFSCPYHAWTFRADGSLLRVPREEGFPDIERSGLGLAQLPVEERHGFIWVVPTPGARIDVASHLGALDAELASYDAAAMVLERQDQLRADMNWKFVLDGFLEVYHFATLHAKTIAPYFHGNYSPFDAFGRHGRMVGVRSSFDKVRGQPKGDIATPDLIKHLAINYYIFPNTILVWQGDHFECWTAFPGDRPDRCVAQVQAITTREAAQPEFETRWDRNWKVMIDTVVDEDWAMSRTIQESVHAMPGNRILFGRNEPGLQHFHAQLARQVEAGAPAA